jgi:pimeloyl-ACP methyl ester carboxylesterase
MPFAELPDARVHYTRDGQGPPIVLVHGTAAGSEQWAEAVAALAGRHAVICPDLSGSGRTTDSGAPLTVDALAAQVIAVIADAAIEGVHIVGHSMGAVVAAAVSAQRPDLVAGAVLHAGWACSDVRLSALFGAWSSLLHCAPLRFAELILTTALSPAFLAALDAATFATAAADLLARLAPGTDRHIDLDARVDIGADLARLRVAVLLLASDQDQIITPDHHDALVAALPHAQQARLRAGHGAPAEAMPELLEQIVAFADIGHRCVV